MRSVSVSSCRCCMFVSCVHPVAVLNAAFCMTCSLLMLVEDAIGDHTEEAYSRAGIITALYEIRNTKYEIVYFKNMIKNKWQKMIIIRIK